MKKAIKRLAIYLIAAVGPAVPTPTLRRWLWTRVTPRLLDTAVTKPGYRARKMRRVPVVVPCDPYVYTQANNYWCGRFFEEDLERYLLRTVSRGDTVIDIGMNVGQVALPAAALVGPEGKVIAFEPNPDLARLVAKFAAEQGLTQLSIRNVGLSDQSATMTLRVSIRETGLASFRGTADRQPSGEEFVCDVRVGDEELAGLALPGRVFLKMDVEGFELHALRGLSRFLAKVHHAVIEVSPEWIDANELFAFMRRAGFVPRRLTKSGLPGDEIGPVTSQANVLFVKP